MQSQAANKSNVAIEKERLVLMPLRLEEADKSRQAAMEVALLEGLQQKYEVFAGAKVANKAREIFNKESHNTAHNECDETRCLQNIAEAFQAELIAVANVSKQDDGYFLALTIRNIFDDKVVYSKSTPCKNCDAYQVVDKLKELSVFEKPSDNITSHNIESLPIDANNKYEQIHSKSDDKWNCPKLLDAATEAVKNDDNKGIVFIAKQMISASCELDDAYGSLIDSQVGLKQYRDAEKTYHQCISFDYTIAACHVYGAILSLKTANSEEAFRRAKIAHSQIFASKKTKLGELQADPNNSHSINASIHLLDALEIVLHRNGL